MPDIITHPFPDEQTDPVATHLVLIIDDDPDFLSQHSTALKSLGFGVVVAKSREQALLQLETHTPALAVVDCMIAERDAGFALCQEIKKRRPDTPIIAVTSANAGTGTDSESLRDDQRMRISADAVLTKPIRFDQLAGQINQLLDR